MKFKVVIIATTDARGLELEAEYDRLGFPEDNRPDVFGRRRATVEVSKDFAKSHPDLFGQSATARIHVPLESTNPSDWEDWGATGMVLNYQSFDESWIESRLP